MYTRLELCKIEENVNENANRMQKIRVSKRYATLMTKCKLLRNQRDAKVQVVCFTKHNIFKGYNLQ